MSPRQRLLAVPVRIDAQWPADDHPAGHRGAPSCEGDDGVQYATGCTLGKGNLGVTRMERARTRAFRVSYKPTLHRQIAVSAWMTNRSQGIDPDAIPEPEQRGLVTLIWDGPAAEVLTLAEGFPFERDGLPEGVGSVPCTAWGERTAQAYLGVRVPPRRGATSAEPRRPTVSRRGCP